MSNIESATIKEIQAARDIVQEIRNYGVNDNIICMIVEKLALELIDIELMKDLRKLASRGSCMSDLKSMAKEELTQLQQEMREQNG